MFVNHSVEPVMMSVWISTSLGQYEGHFCFLLFLEPSTSLPIIDWQVEQSEIIKAMSHKTALSVRKTWISGISNYANFAEAAFVLLLFKSFTGKKHQGSGSEKSIYQHLATNEFERYGSRKVSYKPQGFFFGINFNKLESLQGKIGFWVLFP